ncbi:MAG: 30S ribosomal protein S15 [Lentisphaeria bacterium]|nr:30S ribosomal protein S15 [Lentisphaeria bacterium]
MTKEEKTAIITEFGGNANNTGSTEVQIALLTARIKELTEHIKLHKKDNHSRRGLIALVAQRRKLLVYLTGKSVDSYKALIAKLGLRR